jgi:hypothetical protein
LSGKIVLLVDHEIADCFERFLHGILRDLILMLRSLGCDQIEYSQRGAARDELQPFRYSGMRFMVSMTRVPGPVAGQIGPICHEPEFIWRILWAENIHPHKTRSMVDKVRP